MAETPGLLRLSLRAVSDGSGHCEEPTGRANARPMTGSATKQSIVTVALAVDCFAWARNDGGARVHFTFQTASLSKHGFAISPRLAREFYLNFPSSCYRGRRECRALDAPAASRVDKKHASVVTTVTPEITRHSPRNGFTAYFVLSPVTRLV